MRFVMGKFGGISLLIMLMWGYTPGVEVDDARNEYMQSALR